MTNATLRTAVLAAFAGIAAVLGLLAGPAGAQTAGPNTSGGARATSDSVASGTCVALDDSVCSGSGLSTTRPARAAPSPVTARSAPA
ncbi:MAG: hypothetical protein M3163_09610, partial [Actinomycetota bacterium]|nr:hypothetical protein [Actinomycetota bacterium]